jgi:hypothetical protein
MFLIFPSKSISICFRDSGRPKSDFEENLDFNKMILILILIKKKTVT